MKKFLFSLILTIAFIGLAQNIVQLKKIKPAKDYENIYIQKLESDKNASSFLIWIKENVRIHKHAYHTETIIVLEGKGIMTIGEEVFNVKKNDYFVIPENTPHALTVTSGRPVKVISIQSPEFKGLDRIFLDEVK